MLTGGCFCKAVRFETDGTPYSSSICHCAMCRGVTGAPVVAWFSVPRAGFRWTAGKPTTYRSSDRATRSFCGACGTQLLFQGDNAPDEVDITTAALDAPEAVPPVAHIHTTSQLSWIRLADGLPRRPAGSSS